MKSKPVKKPRQKAVQETAVPVEPRGKYGKKHSPATLRMRKKAQSLNTGNKSAAPSTGNKSTVKAQYTGNPGNKSQATKPATTSKVPDTGKQAASKATNTGKTQAQTAKHSTGSTKANAGKTKANQARTTNKRYTSKTKGNRHNTQGTTIGRKRQKTVGFGPSAGGSADSSGSSAEEPMIPDGSTEFSGGLTTPIDQLSARFSRTLARVFRKGRALRSDAKPPTVKLIRAICAVIRQGNHVETAVRAFGVRGNVYRQWIERGFQDIAAGDSTPYALFVAACDAADAQTEALDIMAIRHGIENWQALTWLRERKSFARWGLKSIQLTAGAGEPMAAKLEHSKALEPELAANVLMALEEAGIVTIPGQEHESGIPEEIIIEGRAQDSATVEAGEAVVAEMRD